MRRLFSVRTVLGTKLAAQGGSVGIPVTVLEGEKGVGYLTHSLHKDPWDRWASGQAHGLVNCVVKT